jgi:hypothetical protein
LLPIAVSVTASCPFVMTASAVLSRVPEEFWKSVFAVPSAVFHCVFPQMYVSSPGVPWK